MSGPVRRSLLCLAVSGLAIAIGGSNRVGEAQQPAPVRVSLLRDDLAEVFQLKREQVHLNLPPAERQLLGAVFTIDPSSGRLQIVERLDADWFAVGEAVQTELTLTEDVWLNPAGQAFAQLIEPAQPPEADVAARVRLSEIQRRLIRLSSGERVAAAILHSTAVLDAARAGKPLLMAESVIAGKVSFQIRSDALVQPAEARLPGFELNSRIDENLLQVESNRAADIAFTAQRLVLQAPEGDARPNNVLYQTALVDSNLASPWDREHIRIQAVYGVQAVQERTAMKFHAYSMDAAKSYVPEPAPPNGSYGTGASAVRPPSYSHGANYYRPPNVPRTYSAPTYRPPVAAMLHDDSPAESFIPLAIEADLPSTGFGGLDPEVAMPATDVPPPDVPPERKNAGNEVTVLYGTCRAMVVEPPTWTEHLLGFIGTTNGWITVAGLAIVAIIAMLGLGFARRLSLASAVVVLALCGVLYGGAAIVQGVQREADFRKVEGIYGNQRGDLQYGWCKVSVPQKREKGTPPSPFSVYLIRMPEDPEKHFIVKDLRADKAAFIGELKSKVAGSNKKDAFVFIHGFNVTFGDAVKRTAQLCVDMEFQGAPLCFTWPSQGELKDYLADSATARVAAFRLREFLLEVEKESGAERIHLIAHSMGNEVLTQAMKEMHEHLREPNCRFREVLLAAPDIDKDVFRELSKAIRNDVQHITLYASENDRALNESYRLSKVPRAGMAGEFLTLVDGVDTIDVSNLDTDFLGHSTYGDHELAVRDLGLLVREGKPPGERGLIERLKGERAYWLIRN